MAAPEDSPRSPDATRYTGDVDDAVGRQPTVAVATRPNRTGAVRQRSAVRVPVKRRRRRRRAPVLVGGVVAALLAAAQTYLLAALVIVIMLRSGGGGPGIGTLSGLGAAAWLLTHFIPVHADGGTVGMFPLAFTAFAAWRLYRAGVHTIRTLGGLRTGNVRFAIVAGCAVALPYAGIAAGVAALSSLGVASAPVPRSALTAFGFAVVLAASGAGGRHGTGCWTRTAALAPPILPSAIRAGLSAALLVWAAGAVVAGVSLAVNGAEAGRFLSDGHHLGFGAQLGKTMLCLPYLPNLGLWGAAYLAGPGFAVGTAQISAAKVTLGVVPSFPVLAGLPDHSASGLVGLLLYTPVVAGAFVAMPLGRRHRTWLPLLGAALLAAAIAGAALGLGALASSGALRGYADNGPVGWQVAVLAGVAVAVGTVLGVTVTRLLGPRPAGRAGK
jgi:hypothetical protein